MMSDNLKLKGPQDRSRVNIHEPWELSYWSKHFNITPDQRTNVVKKVGVMVKDVEAELKKK
jgi:hypothetical protein